MGVLQAGGIELLLPGSGVAGQPKAFMLRETTDSSAPSFMFADLDGRLSKPTCASALQSACVEASRHSICLLPGSARILRALSCCAAMPPLFSPQRRRAQSLITTQQHHATLQPCFHPQEAGLGEACWIAGINAVVQGKAEKKCALVSILKDSHIVELSSLNSHAGVAGQVKRKYDLAMSALGDQVRALSTLHICASLYEVQQS